MVESSECILEPRYLYESLTVIAGILLIYLLAMERVRVEWAKTNAVEMDIVKQNARSHAMAKWQQTVGGLIG